MRCPICKKPVDASSNNRFRPFCSERCQTIDLGAWAGEEYRAAGAKTEDHHHPGDEPPKKILH